MIQIKDNGEKLVDIETVCSGLIIDLTPKRKAYFRKTVAEMICKAKSFLPKGTTFIIGDAWRSQKIQKWVWFRRYNRLKRYHPDWPEKKIIELTEEFVAPYEGKEVSGHMTGASVDLRLWRNNRKIPMKSGKLTFEENALSGQKKLPRHILENRKLLFSVLEKAGLSNYPKEYWHWSYGDLWWAKRKNKKQTFYGPIFKF